MHDAQYVQAFCAGTLDAERVRRIGFGDVTRTAALIERTKVEVAGAAPKPLNPDSAPHKPLVHTPASAGSNLHSIVS